MISILNDVSNFNHLKGLPTTPAEQELHEALIELIEAQSAMKQSLLDWSSGNLRPDCADVSWWEKHMGRQYLARRDSALHRYDQANRAVIFHMFQTLSQSR